MKTSKIKKTLYFTYGLVMILGFTAVNLTTLVKWTLIDGRKPVFDLRQKQNDGGVVINDHVNNQLAVAEGINRTGRPGRPRKMVINNPESF